ncbi:MAG: hypothetical protein NT159_15645 [Proteobacteria bacterium]|nr:hypothetical protein [Pseudomonadota bacterium]
MRNKLDDLLKHPLEQAPAGYFSRIRVIPDLFSDEVLNVGIGIIGADGRRHVRVISTPGRLECLYGDAADNLVELAQLGARAFLDDVAQPSPNIALGEPRPFYNMDPETALATFFRDQVTVAIAQRQSAERPEPVKTEQLRAKVYQLLRTKGEFMNVDGLIPHSPLTIVQTEKGPRTVRIPLQSISGAAGLESADYSGPIIRVHLLDTLLDIEYAADARGFKKLGLFIARPVREMPEKKMAEIDNAIDHVVWRAPRHCRVEVERDLGLLTDKILDWADLKAA